VDKVVIGIIAASVLVLGGLVAYEATKSTTPIGTKVDIQGREHVAEGTKVEYNSEPPTSGPHYGEEAAWGVYDRELPDEQLVHNLEHGGINIFYNPGLLPSEQIEQLKSLARRFTSKVVLAPRAKNVKPVELASWGYYLNMDSFDENTIRDFIKKNKDRGPEFVPD
jgi:hypothetical protein